MSRQSTLLSFFSSPKGTLTPKRQETATPKKQGTPTSKKQGTPTSTKQSKPVIKKDPDYDPKAEDEDCNNGVDDSDEDVKPTPKARKRIRILSDDESESENESPNKQTFKKTKLNSFQFKRQKSDSDNSESSKKLKLNESVQEDKVAKVLENSKTVDGDIHSNWTHNKLEFLKPNNIRDKAKNKPSHPEYDPHTLYVPDDFLNKQTPGMRQWWILKTDHFDSILFFKVGKFYELYHMDAVIGVQHLGFTYMRGEFAHSGFPETAYGKMASMLIEKGFKVARVEQTETPDMMNERIKTTGKKSKYDKVVNREICQVSTKATTVYSAQMPDAKNSLPCYLFAVAEKAIDNGNCRFGVVFVDTSIGLFHLSEFNDDKHCSKLLSLFAENPPGLILTERSKNSSPFSELLKTYFKDIRKDNLLPKTQFFTATTTLEKLSSACYFKDKEGHFHWPSIFKQLADDCIPKSDYELVLKSLGACLWFLQDSEIDIQVFSMGKFEMYNTLDFTTKEKSISRDYMVLDSITIQNLALLGGKGTLQKTLDHCETAFGKRLMIQWICRPLCNIKKIEERQKAVSELWNNPSMLIATQEILKKLPDLERQVAKIHIYGNRFCAQDHPDGRAIFYEAVTYSKRKIQDLLKTLRAFELVQGLPGIFNECESRMLKKLTQHTPDGMFLDLQDTLDFFKTSFDQSEAEKQGKIIPKKGLDADYDRVNEEIEEINRNLEQYLASQSKKFGCKITYFGTDKKRFQLDIPEHKTHKVDSDYHLEGARKGKSKRYHTSETREFLAEMLKAEGERAKIVLDLNRRIFEKFSERRDEWDQVIHCLTILDVLCSLAAYAKSFSQDICMPKIKSFDDQEIIIADGRHPCVLNIDNFVPNDTKMGVRNHAGILLLTGPNMGGKSTLMRQVALISIMAQMGSCVPASDAEISLIDRIFTRLGAHDDIVQGQSTFFVELSEASSILQHATKNSLVLLDELGRGTSTHDGNAIATAYVRKLTEIKCRTMFATHYHTLVDHFIGREDIQLGHMACMVENDEDPTLECVTFLYKMAEGRCPKSYGFNAARLAGLKHSIISRGREVAKLLEDENKNRTLFSNIFSNINKTSMSDIRKMLKNLSV